MNMRLEKLNESLKSSGEYEAGKLKLRFLKAVVNMRLENKDLNLKSSGMRLENKNRNLKSSGV